MKFYKDADAAVQSGSFLRSMPETERSIPMKEKITGILSDVKARISGAASESELQNVKSALFCFSFFVDHGVYFQLCTLS